MADRSGRRPLGTLTRHPLDWFRDHSFVGGYMHPFDYAGEQLTYTSVGLYNFDPNGRVMLCYGFVTQADAGGGIDVFFVNGTIGALLGGVSSLRPDRPAPNVAVYNLVTPVPLNTPPTYNWGPAIGALPTQGFDGGQVFSEFPMFIVPVGYSVVFANAEASDRTGTFCWFQMADQ